jgi:hypothetical protein
MSSARDRVSTAHGEPSPNEKPVPGCVGEDKRLPTGREQAPSANEVTICHPMQQSSLSRRRRRADAKPDPWKDPLEGEEWDGLRWFIHLLAWIRRATNR